jgi:hypothetical protein
MFLDLLQNGNVTHVNSLLPKFCMSMVNLVSTEALPPKKFIVCSVEVALTAWFSNVLQRKSIVSCRIYKIARSRLINLFNGNK